jgi:hypothetical protein
VGGQKAKFFHVICFVAEILRINSQLISKRFCSAAMIGIDYLGGPPKTATMDYWLAQINNALVSHKIPFFSIGYGFFYIESFRTSAEPVICSNF